MSYINRDYLVIQFQNFANKIKELLNNKAVSKEAYDDLIIFSNTQPTSKDNKIWIKEETVDVIKILEEQDVLQVVQQGINNGNIEIATDPQVLSDISGIKNGTITVGKANAVGTLTQQNITEAITGIADDVNELGNAIINGDVVAGNADKLDNHDSSYFLNTTQKGTNNGLAELDENGKVPSSQLPSYVDDIVEYDNLESFPSEGESGKIYIATDTNKTYRWSGTQYVVISETLSLGETSSTAYAGNKGKANADAISALQNVVSALPSSYAPVDAQKNVQSDWNVSDTNSDAFIKNKPSIPNEVTEATVSGWGFTKNTGTYIKPSDGIPASDLASGVIPTSLPANGGNSATVNNHSVNEDVPSGAKFTDTTYSVATTSSNGLMSSGDKTKLSRIFNGHASKISGSIGWYKININSEKSWMLAFTVRLYQGYKYYDIVFSGYQNDSDYWYSPNAVMLGSTTTNIDVKFGYDATNKLWVAIRDDYYTGIDIFDVTNGFEQIDDTANLFTITNLATLTGTIQKEMTVYRPIYKNEIQMSTTDLTAGTSTLATGTVYIVYE